MKEDELKALLKEVCHAAIAYDKGIQFAANQGKAYVESNILDELYLDWLTKSTNALQKIQ